MLASAAMQARGRPVPKAIIAPHAGYVYSGPIAASVYARLAPARGTIERVVLLGPVHRVPVRGLALPGASALATPLGFLLGMSKTLTRVFDPVMQVLRPISPLAWLPLGLIIFRKSEPAALFAIAVCSMWPTVLNTMAGVRAIPQDYWNVAKVLRLSRFTTFAKIVVPATLPYMFTGFRLSLGIAWLVIVASEMFCFRG